MYFLTKLHWQITWRKFYRLASILLWLISLWFLSTQPAYAQQLLFADNFNDGNFDDWQVVRNAQWQHLDRPCLFYDQAAQWEIIDGQLGITIDSHAGCTTEIVPQDFSLTNVPAFRYEFDWYFKESTQMDRNVIIKWKNADNWYGLKVLRNKIKLQKIINGLETPQYSNWGYYDFAPDQQYHFKIEVVDNIITVWVEDKLIFQTIDHFPHLDRDYTLGLGASTGAIVRSASYFDNLQVFSLSKVNEKRLGVPLFKQHDPEWKSREYDHAQDWSKNPTLQRWGCALSSAAMILRYYGLDQVPTGQAMNPEELNLWLRDQSDGFIGQGLLNWLAISRLTQLVSQKLETPILEYGRQTGQELKKAIAQINQDQPVILQLPGHFTVADGYTAQQDDLYLKDPAYRYQLLSQHQKKLLSIRTFKPSRTDLSYFLFMTQPGVELTLINQSQGQIVETQTYNEYLQDPTSDLEVGTQISQLTTLAKPSFGNYQLQIVSQTLDPILVEFYFYDQLGVVQQLSRNVQGVELVEFKFQPEEEIELQTVQNKLSLFQLWLDKFYQDKQVWTRYVYRHLSYLTQHEKLEQLRNNLEIYQDFIEPPAQEKLLRLLSQIEHDL